MSTAPEIVLIAAVARNGAIGRGEALLFNEAADQRHFRQATLGCPVIMGRKTWDSLPSRFRPLPGRSNIVISGDRARAFEGAQAAANLEDALALAGNAPRVFVIGGAQLYALALPRAHTLMLTEIDAELDGDAFFPHWPRAQFTEVSRERHLGAGGLAFDFVTYRRAPP
jgi:dihydrofolate reductase